MSELREQVVIFKSDADGRMRGHALTYDSVTGPIGDALRELVDDGDDTERVVEVAGHYFLLTFGKPKQAA